MRLKVIVDFKDKYTGEFNPVGTELTVDDDRGAELVKAGVVEVITEVIEVVAEAPVKKSRKPKKA